MKEIVSLLEEDQIDFANHKRREVLMVLRRKFRTQKDWIITSFNQYQFTKEESQKVQQAILNGDLRITDFLIVLFLTIFGVSLPLSGERYFRVEKDCLNRKSYRLLSALAMARNLREHQLKIETG